MPTIEIICLGAKTLPALPTFNSFGWLAERELKSHRGIFQPVFNTVTGFIVHLVNKGYELPEHDGGLFAGDLIQWGQGIVIIPELDSELGEDQWHGENQIHGFQFIPEVVPELRQLMKIMRDHSPENGLYFSTDLQFGPDPPREYFGYSLDGFFEEHDEQGLEFNSLYHLTG